MNDRVGACVAPARSVMVVLREGEERDRSAGSAQRTVELQRMRVLIICQHEQVENDKRSNARA